MSVVGFHLGNESCFVAVARQRSIDVVLNNESRRETNSVSQIKRLGRRFSDPELQRDLQSMPFSVTKGPDGFPLFHTRYLGHELTFTPTQVLGMVLSNLKDIAEKNLNAAVVDCCIGIPVYFTDLQRRAVLDAATMAGLNPLRLFHDTTAMALAYGIYKNYLPQNDQMNVAFVDVGHASMQVCIARFKKGHLNILAHAYDRSLGGRDFDEALFKHFAAKFKEEYKIDVYQNARACKRLRASCEKLKKVLSANPEAPLNIECLIDGKDVRGFIKREEFEQISIPILECIKGPLERALLDAELRVDNLQSYEVVGSGSRVPAILKILAQFFGEALKHTINSSDCVACGCALQCAILSPTFRVREFEVHESFPFSIALSWKSLASDTQNGETDNQQSAIVFAKGYPIPSFKMLTFYRSNIFSVDVFYADVSDLQVPAMINTYTIGPSNSTKDERAKIKLNIRLNLHGIISVESRTMLLEEKKVAVPVSAVKESAKESKKMDTDEAKNDFFATVDIQNAAQAQALIDCIANSCLELAADPLAITASSEVSGFLPLNPCPFGLEKLLDEVEVASLLPIMRASDKRPEEMVADWAFISSSAWGLIRYLITSKSYIRRVRLEILIHRLRTDMVDSVFDYSALIAYVEGLLGYIGVLEHDDTSLIESQLREGYSEELSILTKRTEEARERVHSHESIVQGAQEKVTSLRARLAEAEDEERRAIEGQCSVAAQLSALEAQGREILEKQGNVSAEARATIGRIRDLVSRIAASLDILQPGDTPLSSRLLAQQRQDDPRQ